MQHASIPVVDILGAPVARLSLTETAKLITGFVQEGRPRQVITLNPEYLVRAQSSPELLETVRRADLVTADGVGIVWAAKKAGAPVPERVTGIDLLQRLAREAGAQGWRVFLLGSRPGVAAKAGRNLTRQYPGLHLVGTEDGYFGPADEPAIIDKIRASGADLLFVGLGAPRQELWTVQNLENLGVPVVIGVGGSFDVVSGEVQRVPSWLQRLNLEWLGRLASDPKRWRRQLVLPEFVFLVWRYYRK